MNFLQSETITSFTVHRTEIVFFRKIGQRNFLNRTRFCNSDQQKKAYAIKNENIVYLDCVSEIWDTLGVKINDKANENEIKEICELIKKFQKVFEQTEQLSCITEVPITTVEGKSEFVRQHPIPHKFKDGLKNEILKMLKMGIIEPCKNPRGWNSPILPVKKKL